MKTSKAILFSIILALWIPPHCGEPVADPSGTQAFNVKKANGSVAVFAGGCFWCMESPFEKVKGVKAVYSGYTGGDKKSPTYEEVSSGGTGHIESVLVVYDPNVVSYSELLDTFWRNINPMQDNGQFYDIGSQYRTVIFYNDDSEKMAAQQSKEQLDKSGRFEKPIVTRILPFSGEFWIAEEYHQDYYKKNPAHYQSYRRGSGRDDFIEKYWGKSEH